MGSSHSTHATPQLPTGLAKRGMPPVLQVKLKHSWSRLTATVNEPGASPSYCLTLPEGWYGSMTLRDGPLETDTPIAHCDMKGKMQLENVISLPPPTTGDARTGKEILRYKWGKREKYWFAMDVGEGSSRRVEKFEWRRSKGKEVRKLGQGSFGWKLVRLSPGDCEEDRRHEKSEDEGEEEAEGDGEEVADAVTSDGKEVVAVWANASLRRMSMTNVGELKLCGAGATGDFGLRWGLMVVMTCISMWQKENAAAVAA